MDYESVTEVGPASRAGPHTGPASRAGPRCPAPRAERGLIARPREPSGAYFPAPSGTDSKNTRAAGQCRPAALAVYGCSLVAATAALAAAGLAALLAVEQAAHPLAHVPAATAVLAAALMVLPHSFSQPQVVVAAASHGTCFSTVLATIRQAV